MEANKGLNPGDVVLVGLPLSNGHEQHGLRPGILITGLTRDLVTAVPLTTNNEALFFPHTLSVKPTKNNGLSFSSVALIAKFLNSGQYGSAALTCVAIGPS